ncbi:MAG TPA: guanylate kinase [Quisquiliibacterium sp.]|nr:guanylate kinase [Quisquiliibacterium sp.]
MSTPSSASAAETRGQPAPAAGSAPSADACGAPAVAGSLFVVVAPSGAGKTSLVRALMAQRPDIELSVSFTTRAPRPGEVDGRDYVFVGRDDFERRRDAGEFLEWAHVHGNYYATSRPWIAGRIAQGRDILLEIDCQGADQVLRLFPDAVRIFIAPPSLAVLRERLVARGQDAPEVIEGRLAAARGELAEAPKYQYVIINQDFAVALSQLVAIFDCARLRFPKQQARHPALFQQLFGPGAAADR